MKSNTQCQQDVFAMNEEKKTQQNWCRRVNDDNAECDNANIDVHTRSFILWQSLCTITSLANKFYSSRFQNMLILNFIPASWVEYVNRTIVHRMTSILMCATLNKLHADCDYHLFLFLIPCVFVYDSNFVWFRQETIQING